MRTNLSATLLAILPLLALTPRQATETGAPIVIYGKSDTFSEHLLIPVRFNGAPLWCSLDSGFSALVAVDQARAEQAGLIAKSAIPTPDGRPPTTGDSSARATLETASVSLGEQSVILRRFAAEAPDTECIMGVGLLRRFVVELDYGANRVRLHDRNGYRPPNGVTQIPLIFRTNPNVPFVQIVLTFADGTSQSAQVVTDTGAAFYAAVLVPSFVDKVRDHIGLTALPAERPDSSRPTLQFTAARTDAISVGPIAVREPIVALISSGLGEGIDDGVLGVGFFRRFSVAFDFEGRRMYLAPNEHLTERAAFDASGVSFRLRRNQYQADLVIPDTASARAGLREGDRLLDIDGHVAEVLTPAQLRERLSRPGESRMLHVARGNQTLTIMLKLEERL
jgi:hypothetical protein